MGVKASGGVKDDAGAVAMIQAGATRLGTSPGMKIVEGVNGQPNCINCGRCTAPCPTGNVTVCEERLLIFRRLCHMPAVALGMAAARGSGLFSAHITPRPHADAEGILPDK